MTRSKTSVLRKADRYGSNLASAPARQNVRLSSAMARKIPYAGKAPSGKDVLGNSVFGSSR